MEPHRPIFVKDLPALEKALCGLKDMACLFCGRRGTLNRHGGITGNDPHAANGRVQRGHRVYCSRRGRRGGCGRTFPILLARVLPRHTFNAALLWAVLERVLDGHSIRAAWAAARVPLALDTTYHLIQRLRRHVSDWRTALSRLIPPPPAGNARDPLLQTIAHLRGAFPACACPVEVFQLRLQRAVLSG